MVTGRAHPSAASLSDLAAYKPTEPKRLSVVCGLRAARVAGSAEMLLSIPVTMVFLRTMFVVMLVLDCLVCVYGERLEDTSDYQTCIANPAGCTYLCVPPSSCPPACVPPGRSCPRTG